MYQIQSCLRKKKIINTAFFTIILIATAFPAYALGETDSASSLHIPWSGWWWPSKFGGLGTGADYQGHPAPLEKYDLFISGSYPGPATSYYLEHDYDPDDTIDWSGLCHAWAAAAVFEHIEFFPSSVDNIIFNVGDKKGLITACHEHDQLQYGNPEDPSVFHWWLLNYIKDQGLAFYAELDPSEEVWNFPVYRYEMDMTDRAGAIDVQCKIWYASDFVDPDYQGTSAKTNTYTYTLYTSGGAITGGQWTGDSGYDHPQRLVLPVSIGTYNPHLDYDLVREIAVSKDDPLESEQPSELMPGGYNLILLDEDVFKITTLPGEYIFLSVAQIDDISENLQVKIEDKDGFQIQSGLVDDVQQEFVVVSENPPYFVTISRSDYGIGGVYRLNCDLKKNYQFVNPNIQKGFAWGGFAITNSSEKDCDTIYVTGYQRDGSPLETYAGPISLLTGQKRIVQISEFNVRAIEKNDLFGVKIHAPNQLEVLNLSGYYDYNMSAMSQIQDADLFIIPDTQFGFSLTRYLNWGLYNASPSAANVDLKLFSSQGELMDEATLNMSCNQTDHFNGNDNPFEAATEDGWIMVRPGNDDSVGGYMQWLARDLSYGEILPLLIPGSEFTIPHISELLNWKMTLILINPNNTDGSVRLELLNGIVIDEREVFLKANEKKTISLGQFYQDISITELNQCGLSISAPNTISGYFTFESNKDHLYFKLPPKENTKKTMTIPHVASSAYWWTAVNLFNPSPDSSIELSFVPYDAIGNQMLDHKKQITINPLTKEVFTIKNKWDTVAGQISQIQVIVEKGSGVVGLFAYGNHDSSMLAGNLLE